jgi:hypothetical protein
VGIDPLPVLFFGRIARAKWPRRAINSSILLNNFGAGEGIRTLDPNLGKNSKAPAGAFQYYDTTLLNQQLIDI